MIAGMTPSKSALIMGVTGGSGSGKSYLTGLLSGPTAHIVDMDKVGHLVLEGSARKPIMKAFGLDILDRTADTLSRAPIDRKKLGAVVFADPTQLAKLNAIVHPLVCQAVYLQILEHLYTCQLIVLDGALLFDVGLHHVCDVTVLVLADQSVRVQRIMARDAISETQALNRLNSQRDYEQLIDQATVVVYNNG